MAKRVSQAEPTTFFGEIYLHYNPVNGKGYVGQTTQGMEARWYLHRKSARSPKTPAYRGLFSKAIRKYGAETFEHQVLTTATSQEQLDNFEKLWIWALQTKAPNGYNLTNGGDSGTAGHIVSPEVRANLSAKQKANWEDPEYRAQHTGYQRSLEYRAKQRKARLGRHINTQTPEGIAKRVAKLTGQKRTPEQRARMAASHVGLPWSEKRRDAYIKNPPPKLSLESIAKIVAKNTGKKRTPKQIQNILQGVTPEGRERRRRSLLGNKHTLGLKFTPEQIAKRTASLKRNRKLKAAHHG